MAACVEFDGAEFVRGCARFIEKYPSSLVVDLCIASIQHPRVPVCGGLVVDEGRALALVLERRTESLPTANLALRL